MSDHPTDFVGSIPDAITAGIKQRIPDATVEVSGGGGHWSIVVVSPVFAGKGMLENQRLVLGAIKHLLDGANPPVRHTMSQNFWNPRSEANPASVTT